jgi:NAD(P)-dependent dehydrogenase (short-subunit alcohol dehydrogenase family)
MPTVLITGTNRGLGLEFARQYAEAGWNVIATARDPDSADDLRALRGVRVERLDMSDLDEVERFGQGIDELDLLVANAGTYGPREVHTAEAAREWEDTFAVNTIAPFLLAETVLPAVGRSRGKLIAITSKMGSIADNNSGGYIAYRTSKAALNAAWRVLAVEVRSRGVVAAVLHPGWVQTRMGGASAPLEPEESVAGMRRVIEQLGPEHSGSFFDYAGEPVPW